MTNNILLTSLIVSAITCLIYGHDDVKSVVQIQTRDQPQNTSGSLIPSIQKQMLFGGNYNTIIAFENLLKRCDQIDATKLDTIVKTKLSCESEHNVNPLSHLTDGDHKKLVENLGDFHGRMVKYAEYLKKDVLELNPVKAFVQKIHQECNTECEIVDGRASKKRKLDNVTGKQPRYLCFFLWATRSASAKKEVITPPTKTLQGWVADIQIKFCSAKSEFRQNLSIYKTVLELDLGTDPTFTHRIVMSNAEMKAFNDNVLAFDTSMQNETSYLSSLFTHFLDSEDPETLVKKINQTNERTEVFFESVTIDMTHPIWVITWKSYEKLFLHFEQEIKMLVNDTEDFVNGVNQEDNEMVIKELMKILREEQRNLARYAIFNYPMHIQNNYLWNGALSKGMNSLHHWIIAFEDLARHMEAIFEFEAKVDSDEDIEKYDTAAKSAKCKVNARCVQDMKNKIYERKMQLATFFMPKLPSQGHDYNSHDVQTLDMGLIAIRAIYYSVTNAKIGIPLNFEVFERIGKSKGLIEGWFKNGHCTTDHPHVNISDGNSGDMKNNEWLNSVTCAMTSVTTFLTKNSKPTLAKVKNYWTNQFEEVLRELHCWNDELNKII